jgi:glucokinase-like ROK family protein
MVAIVPDQADPQGSPEAVRSPRRVRGHGASRRVRFERDSLARVLRLVRTHEGITRQEIESGSGFGRAVVADRIATLVERGLVEDSQVGVSTGGRAPRCVRLRYDAGHLLVASLGTTTLGVGLSDLSGRLLVEHHEQADAAVGAERTIDRLSALFDWMLEEHPEARPIWGIGIAVPGPVELPGGRLSGPPTLHRMPGWHEFPIARILGEQFGASVWLDNEVHLMTIGERYAGRASGADVVLFVKIGTGISAGLLADGRVHRGAYGFAGDIGHVVVDGDAAVLCRCGNTGCLEALAGGAAIAREARRAASSGQSRHLAELADAGQVITATQVGAAANRGDPFSIELLANSGRLIGETLATLVNAYNPSLVIVGGGVAQAGEILIGAIREAIYRRSRSLATRNLQIVRAEMGRTAGLVGAARAVTDELFAPDYVRSWIEHGVPTRTNEIPRASVARPDPGRAAPRAGRRRSGPRVGTVATSGTRSAP